MSKAKRSGPVRVRVFQEVDDGGRPVPDAFRAVVEIRKGTSIYFEGGSAGEAEFECQRLKWKERRRKEAERRKEGGG